MVTNKQLEQLLAYVVNNPNDSRRMLDLLVALTDAVLDLATAKGDPSEISVGKGDDTGTEED